MLKSAITQKFTYHAPKEGQPEKYGAIRLMAKELAYFLNDKCPDSEEKNMAIQKLDEAVMWANAAIARHG